MQVFRIMRRRLVAMAAVAAIVLLVFAGNLPFTRRAETCVICRLNRVESCYGPLPISRVQENDCSRWYATHVEAEHRHIWEPGTCTYFSNLLGFNVGVACSPGHYPIHLLPSKTQLLVYQHFKNPLDAKTLFANLTDAKTHNDRLDEDDEDRGHLTVRAMSEWEAAGFPGTWDDWWSRFYASHVAERKGYAEWLKDDTKLGFDEWKRQRSSIDRSGQGR